MKWNRKYPLATNQAAQNQNETNTGGLAKLFKLKIGTKVMLPVNIDIQDRLMSTQLEILGKLSLFEAVFVKFM